MIVLVVLFTFKLCLNKELQALQEAILNKSYKVYASEMESSKLPIFIRPKDALVQHALGTLLNHKFCAQISFFLYF